MATNAVEGDIGTFEANGGQLKGRVIFVGPVKDADGKDIGQVLLVRADGGDVWQLKNDGTNFKKTGTSGSKFDAQGGRRRKTRRRSVRRRGA